MSGSYYRRTSQSSTTKICLYKLLNVSQSATSEEIKKSYRRLAFEYHPDRNRGCTKKLAHFKLINDAYDTLMNVSQRREYDQSIGNIFNNFRANKDGFPRDFGKVYAPSPPPEWKTVWNYQKHYEMHYGDGIMKEAFERFKKKAEKDGSLEYQSPLGRGFSFVDDGGDDSANNNNKKKNVNPYSKRSPQGPPKLVFEYQEVELDVASGKQHTKHRERIVHDLHTRRKDRHQKMRHTQQQQQQQQQANTRSRPHMSHSFAAAYGQQVQNPSFTTTTTGSSSSSSTSRNNKSNECVIL